MTTESTGTARFSHEMSAYDKLENDYDSDVALTVTTKALQQNFPEITRDDVQGCVKVVRAIHTGNVSIDNERQDMENQAQKAANAIVSTLSASEIEVENQAVVEIAL